MADFQGIDIGDATQPARFLGGVIIPPQTGTAYFVKSTGNTNYDGLSWDTAKATLRQAAAIAALTAGDYIYIAPGHTEDLLTVLTLADAGVHIVGIGEGDRRPAFTVTGAVDGLSITAADVVVENIRFVTPSAAATANINIAANRTIIRKVGMAQGVNLLDAITITAAGELATIEECDVIVTANGPDSFIRFEGVVDRPIIRNNVIIGALGADQYDDGVIDFNTVTGAGGSNLAVTNPVVYGNYFLGADDATPLTAIANAGSVVGDAFGPNVYAGGTTNADTTGTTLVDNAITAAKIAADAIGAAEIANGAIDAATFAAGAIDAAAIAAGAIDAATFAAGAIDAAAIANGAIDAATFAAGAIDAAAIAAGAIDGATFAADTPLGADNANNAFESTAVVANRDGSHLERLEALMGAHTPAAGDYIPGLGFKVARTAADIVDGTQKALFTVAGGDVLLLGLRMTISVAALDAGANLGNFKTNPTTGADMNLCADLDLVAAAIGARFSITGTITDAMTGPVAGGGAMAMKQGVIVPPGTIDIVSAADKGTGGGLGAVVVFYMPLDAGATVVTA